PADLVEMRLAVGLVLAQRRVRPADEHREIATLFPGAGPERVDLQPLDRQIASFEIKEERGRGVQRPEQAGLADAGPAEDDALDPLALREPFVGADDGKGQHWPSFFITAAAARSAPMHPASRASL